MHLWDLCINIDINTGFQFDGDVVIPDSDLFDPASHQRFVKFGEVGSLLRNIILQVIDPLYLFVPCGGIDGGLLAEFSKPEYFIGTFVSRDYGEFGGALETPGGEIDGNFCDVFELGDRVYAVDSLSHLGLASTTVYSFDRGCKYHKIFSDENLGFKARYVTDERAYILLSDRVGENPKSVLLEISENGDMLKTEFDCDFQLVFNMLVSDGKMFLGADKAVVVVDLQTKEINTYTPLSVEAEKHIIGICR